MNRKLVAVVLLAFIVSVAADALTEDPPSDWKKLLVDGFGSFPGGTIQQRLSQVKSPDGRCVAVLSHREKLAAGGPPEPPKTLERWARLEILRGGKTVYDSGYENLNVYQMSPNLALDVAWSPDSKCLVYRHIASLRVVGPDGKASRHDVAPGGSAISSFRWIDNKRLLVVSKETDYPLDMHGKPYLYNGYTDKAKDVRIVQLHVSEGKTERYRQVVDKPTFLFHGSDFCVEEISPKADRVAFSDGDNLCVYDDVAEKLVVQIRIPQRPSSIPPPEVGYPAGMNKARPPRPGMARPFKPAQLEGVWWQSNDTVLIGVGLLGSSDDKKAFYTYDIPSKVLTNRSKTLLPAWFERLKAGRDHGPNWLYADPNWFRAERR